MVLRISARAHRADPALARRVFVLARQRTIDQDPAFALRMLVDIAIRALSPAINDPTTAVQALDRIESLLAELATRRPGPSLVVDDDGTPRAIVPGAPLGRLHRARADGDPPLRRRVAADRAAAHRALRPPGEVADAGERPRIELERRLLREAVPAAFPDDEERAIVERPDRLGLGGAG